MERKEKVEGEGEWQNGKVSEREENGNVRGKREHRTTGGRSSGKRLRTSDGLQ